jgi:hypothetical protein
MTEIILQEAPNFTPAEDLDYWSEYLDRVDERLSEFSDPQAVSEDVDPEDMNRIWGVKRAIAESPNVDTVTRYYELFVRDTNQRATIYGTSFDGHPIDQVAYNLGDEVVGLVLAEEEPDGVLHNAIFESIEGLIEGKDGVPTSNLQVLKVAYGLGTATELLGVSGSEYSDKISKILRNELMIKWIRIIDQDKLEDPKWSETQQVTLDWMTKVIQATSELSHGEASDYAFSASRRGDDKDILKVIEAIDYFGVDRMRKITELTGINGVDSYSIVQLERMERLIDDPIEAAKQLDEHDVVVVMVNRVGDYGGVLRRTSEDVDDDTGRVLFFEINNMSDIYRRITKLSKLGIQPSTLLLAAHSNKGQFMVSDERDPSMKKRDIAAVASAELVASVNASDDPEVQRSGDKAYSIRGMNGLARLFKDKMKPSRSIDDPLDDEGRRKVILSACYAGQKTDVADLSIDGEIIITGEDSVISKVAKVVSESDEGVAVDLYGAADGIQMHRTEHGLRYSKNAVEGIERLDMSATRVRLEADGSVSESYMAEIPLRR